MRPGMEHDFLTTSDQLFPADGDPDLVQVKERSLFLGGPISRDYGDDSYPLPDPRVGNSLSLHISLPWGSPASQGIRRPARLFFATRVVPQHSRRFLAVTLMVVYRFGAEVNAVVYYHVLDEQMGKGDGVVGFVLALVLLALAVTIIPLRFTRAIRRGLGDPEFRSLFGLVVLTLAAGTMFYWEVEE